MGLYEDGRMFEPTMTVTKALGVNPLTFRRKCKKLKIRPFLFKENLRVHWISLAQANQLWEEIHGSGTNGRDGTAVPPPWI